MSEVMEVLLKSENEWGSLGMNFRQKQAGGVYYYRKSLCTIDLQMLLCLDTTTFLMLSNYRVEMCAFEEWNYTTGYI